MNQIRNEFSWSKSRDEVFQTCPRQYYFNYYGYWGGWEKGAPDRIRQIYILKNLTNRYMWAGGKVHDCIKHTLMNLQRGIGILDERRQDEDQDSRSGRRRLWHALGQLRTARAMVSKPGVHGTNGQPRVTKLQLFKGQPA